ncbi:MAG: diguanylate cyclase [Aliidongia sp.]|jgi:diguanylate cyclase (GGDEF)-like protein
MTRQTILIADDSATIFTLLSAVLGEQYGIIGASEGLAAVEIATERQPDLILLDAVMSGIDGFEVCRRLRAEERTQRIPIVFLTELNALEDEQRGLELGAIDFIAKPIRPAIVKLRVRNHLELKRYRDVLADLSLVDGLTGIGNRRRFDEFLSREWRRSRRARTPLAVILIDVDYFKPYNDQYGHATGDDCLREVAATIAMLVRRPGDLCVRYGGEEFAAILPQTNLAGARVLAERIRSAVLALEIVHAKSAAAPVVTVSIGIAASNAADADEPDELLVEADRRLYEAKAAGRNRVV